MHLAVNDNLAALDLARALHDVSPERRAYALRYRFESDQRLALAVYLLLKDILRRAYGLAGNPVLALGPNGKPFLRDYPAIHFNFSHCPHVAACVVADCPVGLDVERIVPVDAALAQRTLSAREQDEVLHADNPTEAFAALWTKKEALYKLRGTGLDDTVAQCLETAGGVHFDTRLRRDKGYVLTIAWGA